MNSDPAMLVGYDTFSSVEYSGTLYVDTIVDDDYVGMVFNYQSNRRFMLVSWKQTTQKYWNNPKAEAIAGIQIRMVRSNTGPSQALMNALWHSEDTKRQVNCPRPQAATYQSASNFHLGAVVFLFIMIQFLVKEVQMGFLLSKNSCWGLTDVY